MHFRDPLPDFPSVEQIHCWAQKNAPAMRQELASGGASASDLVSPIHRDPCVRRARARWENLRPFPTDEEILLLLLLMSPYDREFNEVDDKAWNCVVCAIVVMAARDPAPACVHVDMHRREFVPID
jgi:hypothetical protein